MQKLPIEKARKKKKINNKTSKNSKYPKQIDTSMDKEAAENAESKGTLAKE